MALPGEITLPFGDGHYRFCLAGEAGGKPLGHLRELQEKTGVGPLVLLRRIGNGEWLIDDGPEVIRLALIGGGKSPTDALKLVTQYCYGRPPTEYLVTAYKILSAFINGIPPAKKKPAAQTKPKTTEPDGSTSTSSTEAEPRSDTVPNKSTA